LRWLGQKLTILQALKVGPFCPEKWSEDWIEFVAKFLGCDVILGTEVLFTSLILCHEGGFLQENHVQ